MGGTRVRNEKEGVWAKLPDSDQWGDFSQGLNRLKFNKKQPGSVEKPNFLKVRTVKQGRNQKRGPKVKERGLQGLKTTPAFCPRHQGKQHPSRNMGKDQNSNRIWRREGIDCFRRGGFL